MTAPRAIVLALLATACSRSSGLAPAPRGGEHAAAWREDLHALEAELRRHPSPFSHVREADWQAAIAALDARLATADDAHAITGLVRIAALLGDSHTRLFLPEDRHYPVRVLGFEDGLVVAGAAPDAAWAIGKRIVAVDGKPIADVLTALAPLVATDNKPHLDAELPPLLENPVALTGMDLAHGDRVTFTVADGTGTRELVLVAGDKAIALAPPRVLPLHLQGPTQLAYWNKYVAGDRLVYFQYNACEDDGREGSFASFAAGTLAFVDQHPVDRFVIDLRSNTGGNSHVIEPLVDGLAQRPLHVFALVGRETFSSGLLAATELAARAHATIVGTPTGGNPNSFGEILVFHLPRSQLVGQISTKRFVDPRHPGDTLAPDLAVHVTSADWFAGRDPAMDAVLAARP